MYSSYRQGEIMKVSQIRQPKVYHHLQSRIVQSGYYNSDLIFDEEDSTPKIVLEWAKKEGKEIPIIVVPLDPQYLHPLNPPWPNADYMYEFSISDPRQEP